MSTEDGDPKEFGVLPKPWLKRKQKKKAPQAIQTTQKKDWVEPPPERVYSRLEKDESGKVLGVQFVDSETGTVMDMTGNVISREPVEIGGNRQVIKTRRFGTTIKKLPDVLGDVDKDVLKDEAQRHWVEQDNSKTLIQTEEPQSKWEVLDAYDKQIHGLKKEEDNWKSALSYYPKDSPEHNNATEKIKEIQRQRVRTKLQNDESFRQELMEAVFPPPEGNKPLYWDEYPWLQRINIDLLRTHDAFISFMGNQLKGVLPMGVNFLSTASGFSNIGYVPPEDFLTQEEIVSSDIYKLGAVLTDYGEDTPYEKMVHYDPDKNYWRSGEFHRDIAQGFGSFAGFALTSILLGKFKYPGWAATMLSGALSEGGANFDDAIEFGTTYNKALTHSLIGNLAGMTEAFGLGRLFRIGEMRKLIKKGGVGALFTAILREQFAEGIEEGVQEGIQQITNNISERELFNKYKELGDGVIEGTFSGLALGVFMGPIGGVIRHRGSTKIKREQDKYDKKHAIVREMLHDYEATQRVTKILQKLGYTQEQIIKETGLDITKPTTVKEYYEKVKAVEEKHVKETGIEPITTVSKDVEEFALEKAGDVPIHFLNSRTKIGIKQVEEPSQLRGGEPIYREKPIPLGTSRQGYHMTDAKGESAIGINLHGLYKSPLSQTIIYESIRDAMVYELTNDKELMKQASQFVKDFHKTNPGAFTEEGWKDFEERPDGFFAQAFEGAGTNLGLDLQNIPVKQKNKLLQIASNAFSKSTGREVAPNPKNVLDAMRQFMLGEFSGKESKWWSQRELDKKSPKHVAHRKKTGEEFVGYQEFAGEPLLLKLGKILESKTGVPMSVFEDEKQLFGGHVTADGRVHLNAAYADTETPFHEFSHPILMDIKKNNPELFDKLYNDLTTLPEWSEISKKAKVKLKAAYPEYIEGTPDKNYSEEMIATSLGYALHLQETGELDNHKSFKEWITDLLKQLGEWFIGKSNKPLKVSDLKLDTTLGDLMNWLTDETTEIALSEGWEKEVALGQAAERFKRVPGQTENSIENSLGKSKEVIKEIERDEAMREQDKLIYNVGEVSDLSESGKLRQEEVQDIEQRITEDETSETEIEEAGDKDLKALQSFAKEIVNDNKDNPTPLFANQLEILSLVYQHQDPSKSIDQNYQGFLRAIQDGNELRPPLGDVTKPQMQWLRDADEYYMKEHNMPFFEYLYAEFTKKVPRSKVIVEKMESDRGYTVFPRINPAGRIIIDPNGNVTSTVSNMPAFEMVNSELEDRYGIMFNAYEVAHYEMSGEKGSRGTGKFGETGMTVKTYIRHLLRQGYLLISTENMDMLVDINSMQMKQGEEWVKFDDWGKFIYKQNPTTSREKTWEHGMAMMNTKLWDYIVEFAQADDSIPVRMGLDKKMKDQYPNQHYNLFEEKGTKDNYWGDITVRDFLFQTNNFISLPYKTKQILNNGSAHSNLVADLVHSFMWKQYWDRILVGVKNDLELIKRMAGIGGLTSKALITPHMNSQIYKVGKGYNKTLNEFSEKTDPVWKQGNNIMSRAIVVDAETVPAQYKKLFGQGIEMGDGDVIFHPLLSDIYDDLNRVSNSTRGRGKKFKWFKIGTFLKCSGQTAFAKTPVNQFMFRNKVGMIIMSSSLKIRQGYKDQFGKDATFATWDNVLDPLHSLKENGINEWIINVNEFAHLSSHGEIKKDVKWAMSFLSSTGIMDMMTEPEIQGTLDMLKKDFTKLNLSLKEIANNDGKKSEILSIIAKRLKATDYTTINFLLEQIAADRPTLVNHPVLAHLLLKHYIAPMIQDAINHAQKGALPVLVADMGNWTRFDKTMVESGYVKEEDVGKYFDVEGEKPTYTLKDGYVILSKEMAKKHKIVAGDDIYISCIPAAGIHDTRVAKVIGLLPGRTDSRGNYVDDNFMIAPINQYQVISGKDYDIDKVPIRKVGNDVALKNAIERLGTDTKMQEWLKSFESSDESVVHYKDVLEGIIDKASIDKQFASMLGLFGIKPGYEALTLLNPAQLQEVMTMMKTGKDIGQLHNIKIMVAEVMQMTKEQLEAHPALKLARGKGETSAILYNLTHYVLDWKSDPKYLLLNFNFDKFLADLFVDIEGVELKEKIKTLKFYKNHYLAPVRNFMQTDEHDSFKKTGITKIYDLYEAAQKIVIEPNNPFGNTFLSRLVKSMDLKLDGIRPTVEEAENMQNEFRKKMYKTYSTKQEALTKITGGLTVGYACKSLNALLNVAKSNTLRRYLGTKPQKGKGKDTGFWTDKEIDNNGYFETVNNLKNLRNYSNKENMNQKLTNGDNIYLHFMRDLFVRGNYFTLTGKEVEFVTRGTSGYNYTFIAGEDKVDVKVDYYKDNKLHSTKTFPIKELLWAEDSQHGRMLYQLFEDPKYKFLEKVFDVNGEGIVKISGHSALRSQTTQLTKDIYKGIVEGDTFNSYEEDLQKVFYRWTTGAFDFDWSIYNSKDELGRPNMRSYVPKNRNRKMLLGLDRDNLDTIARYEHVSQRNLTKSQQEYLGLETEHKQYWKVEPYRQSNPFLALTLMKETNTEASREVLNETLKMMEESFVKKDNPAPEIGDATMNNLRFKDTEALVREHDSVKFTNLKTDIKNELNKIGNKDHEWKDSVIDDIVTDVYGFYSRNQYGENEDDFIKSTRVLVFKVFKKNLKEINKSNPASVKKIIRKLLFFAPPTYLEQVYRTSRKDQIGLNTDPLFEMKLGGGVYNMSIYQLQKHFDEYSAIGLPAIWGGAQVKHFRAHILNMHFLKQEEYFSSAAALIRNMFNFKEQSIPKNVNLIGALDVFGDVADIAEGKDKHSLLKNTTYGDGYIKVGDNDAVAIIPHVEAKIMKGGVEVEPHITSRTSQQQTVFRVDSAQLTVVAGQIIKEKGYTGMSKAVADVLRARIMSALTYRYILDVAVPQRLNSHLESLTSLYDKRFSANKKGYEHEVERYGGMKKEQQDRLRTELKEAIDRTSQMLAQITGRDLALQEKGLWYLPHTPKDWEAVEKAEIEEMMKGVYGKNVNALKRKVKREIRRQKEEAAYFGTTLPVNSFFLKSKDKDIEYDRSSELIPRYLDALQNYTRKQMLEIYHTADEHLLNRESKWVKHVENMQHSNRMGNPSFRERIKVENIKPRQFLTVINEEGDELKETHVEVLKTRGVHNGIKYNKKNGFFLARNLEGRTELCCNKPTARKDVIRVSNLMVNKGVALSRKLRNTIYMFTKSGKLGLWTEKSADNVASFILRNGSRAMLQLKPTFTIMNRTGGFANQLMYFGIGTFGLRKQLDTINHIVEGIYKAERTEELPTKEEIEIYEMVVENMSTFMGGFDKVLGILGGALPTYKTGISAEEIKWVEKHGGHRSVYGTLFQNFKGLKEEYDEIALQIKKEPGSYSKWNALNVKDIPGRLMRIYNKLHLYTIPHGLLSAISPSESAWINPYTAENLLRQEAAAIQAGFAGQMLGRGKNYPLFRDEYDEQITNGARKFFNNWSFSMIDQAQRRVNLYYNPGLFLSTLGSTKAGRIMDWFAHYTMSMSINYFRTFENMVRMGHQHGTWNMRKQALSIIPIVKPKRIRNNIMYDVKIPVGTNKDGSTKYAEITIEDHNEAARFVRMTGLAGLTWLMGNIGRDLVADIGWGASQSMVFSVAAFFFINPMGTMFQVPIIETLLNSVGFMLAMQFGVDPDPEETLQNYKKRQKVWEKYLPMTEEQYIFFGQKQFPVPDRSEKNYLSYRDNLDIISQSSAQYYRYLSKELAGTFSYGAVNKLFVASCIELLAFGMSEETIRPLVFDMSQMLLPGIAPFYQSFRRDAMSSADNDFYGYLAYPLKDLEVYPSDYTMNLYESKRMAKLFAERKELLKIEPNDPEYEEASKRIAELDIILDKEDIRMQKVMLKYEKWKMKNK